MITIDDVLDWIASTTGATRPNMAAVDQVHLDRVVSAVSAHIRRGHTPPEDETEADWVQAHLMMSARLWGRRNSVNGIGDVNDFGPLRVTSIDPDVANLLSPFRCFNFA